MDDADLAGPIFFCLLLGAFLLLSGKVIFKIKISNESLSSSLLKVHFGYIYGFSLFGCIGLYGVLNLLHPTGLDLWRTCSVLGYCLLPVIGLAAITVVHNLRGPIGLVLSIAAITWSTLTSTKYVKN